MGNGEEEHCYCLARLLCYSLGSSHATDVNSTDHKWVGRIILLSVCKTTRHFWMEKSCTGKAVFHSSIDYFFPISALWVNTTPPCHKILFCRFLSISLRVFKMGKKKKATHHFELLLLQNFLSGAARPSVQQNRGFKVLLTLSFAASLTCQAQTPFSSPLEFLRIPAPLKYRWVI